MADSTLHGLTTGLVSPKRGDLLYVQLEGGGANTDRKITYQTVLGGASNLISIKVLDPALAGDGSASDNTKIIALIAALDPEQHHKIYLPPGTWNFSNVQIPGGFDFYGPGAHYKGGQPSGTPSTQNTAVITGTPDTATSTLSGVGFYDLAFNGGVKIDRQYSRFERCVFYGSQGLLFEGIPGAPYYSLVNHCFFRNITGSYLIRFSQANAVKITNNAFMPMVVGQRCLECTNATVGVIVSGNSFDVGTTNPGALVYGPFKSCDFVNNYIDTTKPSGGFTDGAEYVFTYPGGYNRVVAFNTSLDSFKIDDSGGGVYGCVFESPTKAAYYNQSSIVASNFSGVPDHYNLGFNCANFELPPNDWCYNKSVFVTFERDSTSVVAKAGTGGKINGLTGGITARAGETWKFYQRYGGTAIFDWTAKRIGTVYDDKTAEKTNTASGTFDFQWASFGSPWRITLTGDVTFTFSQQPVFTSQLLLIRLVQASPGGHSVTWPAAVKWPNNDPPLIATSANSVTLVSLYFDGTNYWGTILHNSDAAGSEINVLDYGADPSGATDCTTEIQAALDAATDNDVIRFPSGIYKVNALTFTGNTNVTIIGDGAKLITDEAYPAHTIFTATSCNHLTIRGFDVDTRNGYAVNKAMYGLTFFSCTDLLVENVRFIDARTGISISGCTRSTITKCQLQKGPLPQSSDPTDSLNLHPDYLVNVQAGSRATTISNNHSEQRICIVAPAGGSVPINTVVSNNQSEGSYDSVIYFSEGATGGTVTGNIIKDAGKDAMKFIRGSRDITVTGNYISGAGRYVAGSQVYISFQNAQDCVASGNTLVFPTKTYRTTLSYANDSQTGIHVDACQNVSVTGNTITCDGPHNNDRAIMIENDGNPLVSEESCYGITVTGNTIRHAGQYSIVLWVQEETQEIRDVIISSNYIEGVSNATTGDYHVAGLGLFSGATTGAIRRVVIQGNTIRTCSEAGIYFSGNGPYSDITIVQNHIQNLRVGANGAIRWLGIGNTNIIVDDLYWDGTGIKPYAFVTMTGLKLAQREVGQATLVNGAATVTFATAQPDTNYYVQLTGAGPPTYGGQLGTLKWNTKTTTGFSITSTNPNSTAPVDWLAFRK